MNKVIYNASYGGYRLSNEAMEKYLEYSGIEYIKIDNGMQWGSSSITFYDKDSYESEKYQKLIKNLEWHDLPMGDKKYINSTVLHYDKIPRHDTNLVKVVEELGSKANDNFSDIQVMEIEGNKYKIEEYDGNETVNTPENQNWIVIK